MDCLEVSGATSVEFETCLHCWAGFPLILRQSDLCCSRHPLPPLQQQFGSTLVCTLLQISSSTCFSLRLPLFQRPYFTMSEAEEYEVETIVSKRLRKGRFRGFELVRPPSTRISSGKAEYLVKWKGWEDPDDNTWEPIGNLVKASIRSR